MKLRFDSPQLNPNCQACCLHKGSKAVCINGIGVDSHKPLMIFTDGPDYFADNAKRGYALDCGKFLDWLLNRMSIDRDSVALDYTLRCYTKKLPTKAVDRAVLMMECNQYRFATIANVKPKAIVVLGQTSLEAFTGRSKVGDFSERKVVAWEGIVKKYVSHVWVSYGPAYPIYGDPSVSVEIYRTIYMAAKEAGLEPKNNTEVKPFIWTNKM